ncbi:MAG TPA: phytanoyl-CoA dioxygenase family protein [Thermoanaerobaculia bacterium]|nr:phytanoyl-CoA dioxygenase family protein [Thermoanaerobaculia bacterium]
MSERRIFRDAALQSEFDRNGFVIVDFLAPESIERLRALGEQVPSDLDSIAYASSIMSADLDYRARAFDLVRSEFAAHVASLLSDYRLCYGTFITKSAGDADGRGFLGLHQDPTFVDESRHVSIGIWCPLVDVGEGNGCLTVVPGSHRFNRLPRCVMIPFPYSDLLPTIRANHLVPVPMKAGRAFVYSSALFHGSGANRSGALRLVAGGLAIPNETELLFVTNGDGDHAEDLAMYRVDDDYYQRYRFGLPPSGATFVGFLPYRFEPLDEQSLQRRLPAVRA